MPVCYSKNIEILEKNLGYSFKNKDLLIEALTHKSFFHENPDLARSFNERLEFLGDAVLGCVIASYLFNHPSLFPESIMSKIKSFVVRGSILYEIALKLDLGAFVRLGKGEEETGGRQKRSILANAMEAVFGAVFIDGGYEKVRKVILNHFEERLNIVITSGQYHDYKTELQEITQTLFGMLPQYKIVSQTGEEHKKVFTIEVIVNGRKMGSGIGKSKKEAQMMAAREALSRLTKL
ncbi:MAG: ribonuclease III [Thermodesulfovibrionales bacterium]